MEQYRYGTVKPAGCWGSSMATPPPRCLWPSAWMNESPSAAALTRQCACGTRTRGGTSFSASVTDTLTNPRKSSYIQTRAFPRVSGGTMPRTNMERVPAALEAAVHDRLTAHDDDE